MKKTDLIKFVFLLVLCLESNLGEINNSLSVPTQNNVQSPYSRLYEVLKRYNSLTQINTVSETSQENPKFFEQKTTDCPSGVQTTFTALCPTTGTFPTTSICNRVSFAWDSISGFVAVEEDELMKKCIDDTSCQGYEIDTLNQKFRPFTNFVNTLVPAQDKKTKLKVNNRFVVQPIAIECSGESNGRKLCSGSTQPSMCKGSVEGKLIGPRAKIEELCLAELSCNGYIEDSRVSGSTSFIPLSTILSINPVVGVKTMKKSTPIPKSLGTPGFQFIRVFSVFGDPPIQPSSCFALYPALFITSLATTFCFFYAYVNNLDRFIMKTGVLAIVLSLLYAILVSSCGVNLSCAHKTRKIFVYMLPLGMSALLFYHHRGKLAEALKLDFIDSALGIDRKKEVSEKEKQKIEQKQKEINETIRLREINRQIVAKQAAAMMAGKKEKTPKKKNWINVLSRDQRSSTRVTGYDKIQKERAKWRDEESKFAQQRAPPPPLTKKEASKIITKVFQKMTENQKKVSKATAIANAATNVVNAASNAVSAASNAASNAVNAASNAVKDKMRKTSTTATATTTTEEVVNNVSTIESETPQKVDKETTTITLLETEEKLFKHVEEEENEENENELEEEEEEEEEEGIFGGKKKEIKKKEIKKDENTKNGDVDVNNYSFASPEEMKEIESAPETEAEASMNFMQQTLLKAGLNPFLTKKVKHVLALMGGLIFIASVLSTKQVCELMDK